MLLFGLPQHVSLKKLKHEVFSDFSKLHFPGRVNLVVSLLHAFEKFVEQYLAR